MIAIEHGEVLNFMNALRGMRNPLDSWEKADSREEDGKIVMGESDLGLAKRLCKAGSDHRKFLRQILVSVDITAPIYWWKEFDTYKVATVANSCSTMHTIHKAGITSALFSTDGLSGESAAALDAFLEHIESLRLRFNETKDVAVWREIILLLPSSFNQKRTITMNYETLLNIYHARKNHKLTEWHTLCDWILELPYFAAITGCNEK
jgi:hypothetical protein